MPKEIDGLPVINAKKSITLHILPADIKSANIKEPHNCAAARACRRDLHAKEVRIHLARAYVRTNDNNWVRYIIPQSLRSEIIAFDRGGSFEPGDFKLAKINPSKQNRVGEGRGSHLKKVGPRRKHHVVTDVRMGPA